MTVCPVCGETLEYYGKSEHCDQDGVPYAEFECKKHGLFVDKGDGKIYVDTLVEWKQTGGDLNCHG